jgi:hypothetical protein
MIRYLKIVLLILLIVGCKNNKINKPEKPKNLISKKVMVDVLYDMALISSAKGSDRRILEEKGILPQDYVFTKYNIDSLQFVESNNYYSHDIDLYEQLYNQVKAKLEKDKEGFNEILQKEKAEKAIKDSIATINRKHTDSLRKFGKDENGKQIKEFFKKDRRQSPLKKADSSRISTRR